VLPDHPAENAMKAGPVVEPLGSEVDTIPQQTAIAIVGIG
jgi:hypothetical protein